MKKPGRLLLLLIVFDVDARFGANTYFKRVLGLPGETVAIEDGALPIDGVPVSEVEVDQEMAQREDQRWHRINTAQASPPTA